MVLAVDPIVGNLSAWPVADPLEANPVMVPHPVFGYTLGRPPTKKLTGDTGKHIKLTPTSRVSVLMWPPIAECATLPKFTRLALLVRFHN